MIPIHFGNTERTLYGAFDPAVAPRRRKGVLLLNPWGWEALRAHRTLRTLAARLSASGFDALRFDFSGSGDSYGVLEDASPQAWLEDAEFALDELQAMAGVRMVSVIGLRFGALLGAELAARRTRDLDRLVLWEAPRSGNELMAWLEAAPRAESAAFPVPDGFAGGLREIDPALRDFRRDAMIISSDPHSLDLPLARSVARVSVGAEEPRCWVEDRDHGAGGVPVPLIDRIVTWLKE